MKIEISDYFKKDYRAVYLFKNNMGRQVVEIVHKNSTKANPIKRFISYAKYLWISANNQEVPPGFEIDHINGDGTDDRIENLQAIPTQENRRKAFFDLNKIGVTIVDLECPVCGREFKRRLVVIKKNAKKHPICCCRACSAKYGWYRSGIPFNLDKYIKDCESRSYKVDRNLLEGLY